MTVVLERRQDIDLEAVRRVARGGEDVHVAPAALERVERARAAFLRLIEAPDVWVYGVTSGFGDRAGVRFDAEERRANAALEPSVALTFGEALPERVTRAIVLARLANLIDGHASVSSGLVEAVAGLLADGPLPPMPRHGNGGSGEILALAHLFEPLAASRTLLEKEANALTNGAPCAAGLAADAVLSAQRRVTLAEEVLALTIEAYGAPLEAYDAALESLWDDPFEAEALRNLRARLDPGRAGRLGHQAPVSFRVLPRVLGQARRATAQAAEAATVSLRSVSDNPVFVPPDDAHPDGRVLSTGGYHDARAAAALDALAAAAADLASIAQHMLVKLFFPPGGGTLEELRYHLSLGTMIAAGHAEAARRAAGHTPLANASPGQNDLVSPAFLAWDAQARAGEACDAVLTVVAGCSAHVLAGDGGTVAPSLRPLLDEILECFPPSALGISFGPHMAALAERFATRIHGAT
jgi:histidine ammonia-lyase